MKIITKASYVDIVSKFVDKEESRPYLRGVFFEKHPKKGLTIVATNGYNMGIIYDENGVIDLPPEQNGIVLPISQAMTGIIKKAKTERVFSYINGVSSIVSCDISNHKACATLSKDHVYIEYVEPIDSTFPDWQRALPNGEFKPIPRFSFNPKYLSMFEIKSHEGVSIFCPDESSPALVKIPSIPEFMGVLMPMRVGGDSLYPEWIQK